MNVCLEVGADDFKGKRICPFIIEQTLQLFLLLAASNIEVHYVLKQLPQLKDDLFASPKLRN